MDESFEACFEPLMSFNLPELLAVDLEKSEEVFKSRQLTAGPPTPGLGDDGSQRRFSLQDSSLCAIPPSFHADMSRARSLQNVQEKQSEFLTTSHDSQQNNSDSDTASSDSSGALMPPPSIGTRVASIATAATSVTSERMEPPNQLKITIKDQKQAGESWMDFDAEDATSPDRRYNSMVNFPSAAQMLSLRHDLDESRSMSLNSAVPRPTLTGPLPTSPTSVKSAGDQVNHAKKPLACPTSFPKRRSSLLYRNYPVLPQINVSPSRQTASTHPLATRADSSAPSPDIKMLPSTPPRTSGNEANVYEVDSGIDDRMGLAPAFGYEKRDSEKLSRTPSVQFLEIAPGGVDVESWLESSVDSFSYAQTRADGGHTPLPLPPEVIDTLRVSITCFPETMLQCSSLSIETIRGHSRKLRYRSTSAASIYSESPVSVDYSETPKQSKWKWLPLKRQPSSPTTPTPPSPQRSGLSESLESRYSPSWPRKPDWTAIQNLFPTGTDYLCDALYAHLVAYNYITSLCPRSVTINPPSRPTSKSSTMSDMSLGLSLDLRTSIDIRSSSSDGNSIPLKAASLLGLQDNPTGPIPEPPSSRCNTLRSKKSIFTLTKSASFYEGYRPPTSNGFGGRRPGAPDQNEQVLKDLRLGLAKCISRLVATLRMAHGASGMGANTGGRPKREEDPDFMRALCEIVRLSEERYM
ncbi:hypothetical protein M426DRAFT_27813 [Hypoxylon sp. CI-4A]|nr:hypothetical protein M426DRAFT_27813 [Hypoxylon sp. CI-4A]